MSSYTQNVSIICYIKGILLHLIGNMSGQPNLDRRVQTSISMPESLKQNIDSCKGLVLRSRYVVYLLESALQKEMHLKAMRGEMNN